MEFETLIREFASAAGIAGEVAFDGDGICRFGMDDMVFALKAVPEIGEALAWSAIGELPSEGADRLMETLLKANYLGRAVANGGFSLSEERQVTIHRSIALDALTVESFTDAFEVFVKTAVEWRRLIDEYRPEAERRAHAEKQDEVGLSRLNANLFIRV